MYRGQHEGKREKRKRCAIKSGPLQEMSIILWSMVRCDKMRAGSVVARIALIASNHGLYYSESCFQDGAAFRTIRRTWDREDEVSNNDKETMSAGMRREQVKISPRALWPAVVTTNYPLAYLREVSVSLQLAVVS
jgi:hypothetical protein